MPNRTDCLVADCYFVHIEQINIPTFQNIMPKPSIPQVVLEQDLQLPDLTKLSRGKVRLQFQLPNPDERLSVATDGVSVFDVPLGKTVKHKGAVLTAMSDLITKEVLHPLFQTDFIASGGHIDEHLPPHYRGR